MEVRICSLIRWRSRSGDRSWRNWCFEYEKGMMNLIPLPLVAPLGFCFYRGNDSGVFVLVFRVIGVRYACVLSCFTACHATLRCADQYKIQKLYPRQRVLSCLSEYDRLRRHCNQRYQQTWKENNDYLDPDCWNVWAVKSSAESHTNKLHGNRSCTEEVSCTNKLLFLIGQYSPSRTPGCSVTRLNTYMITLRSSSKTFSLHRRSYQSSGSIRVALDYFHDIGIITNNRGPSIFSHP